jgi:hypothetical protein
MRGERKAGSGTTPSSMPGNREGQTKPDARNGNPRHIHRSPFPDHRAFFQRYGLSLIIFLLSLFFILMITPPGLYTNDEWITANQLHQLDIGHQVTFSEGKYGVTANGTVSAYFTYRQNVLMYSLPFRFPHCPW